ncbi:MAG: Mur ligase family protein, partial [Acidimicrobiia bacterium]
MDRSAVPLSSLGALVGGRIVGDSGTMIADVTHDSREAVSGTLFVAVRGFTTDGHEYAEQAVATGASALCVEETVDGCAVPQLLVADTRSALPLLAAEVHGRPSEQLRIVGITGTNGKTTVAYLLESIVSAAGLTAGRVGTTGASIGGHEIPLPRTTPESSDFQRLLGDMVEQGVDVVAVEVSSHALTLGRVDSVHFAV